MHSRARHPDAPVKPSTSKSLLPFPVAALTLFGSNNTANKEPSQSGFPVQGRREDTLFLKTVDRPNMSLACLVCHSVESPSHSFRSYSVSSSDNEGRCAAIANCIARKSSFPPPRGHSSIASSSKVTPQPANPSNDGMTGPPRLVRSCAVRRDIVRDWNFDEVEMDR